MAKVNKSNGSTCWQRCREGEHLFTAIGSTNFYIMEISLVVPEEAGN